MPRWVVASALAFLLCGAALGQDEQTQFDPSLAFKGKLQRLTTSTVLSAVVRVRFRARTGSPRGTAQPPLAPPAHAPSRAARASASWACPATRSSLLHGSGTATSSFC